MQASEVAKAHADSRLVVVNAAADHATDAWKRVDPDNIVESWTAELPEVLAVTQGAQKMVASDADGYLGDVLEGEGLSVEAASPIAPEAFAGDSAGGLLVQQLYQSVISSLLSIGNGASVEDALAHGRETLRTVVRTQVADAGRLADQVSLTAHRSADGYVRVVVGPTCSRCTILAGRFYRWNAGFQRHPRCDCVHMPAQAAKAAKLVQDPHALYDSLSPRERTRAGWTEADQKALAEGADIFQVTNAHRGVYEIGGRRFTTEGTTKRGFARTRTGKGKPRLTPTEIYRLAGADRDEALRLLYRNGYLLEEPAAARAISFPSAAAEVVDPALKMSVAELKKLAKDNGVPLFGATKKHDMILHIRQWERDRLKSGGKRLLEDGPIGKPIEFGHGAILDAPPLGIPAATPVLSGASLNDWADYFKHDLEQGHHVFLDAAGNTPAEGVRVENLRVHLGGTTGTPYVVAHGTAFRFDGVSYLIEHGPTEYGKAGISRTLTELREAHASFPAAARANRSYATLTGANPDDAYWAQRFNNPTHTAAMSAGNGDIYIWHYRSAHSRIDVDSLRHETGHNLDRSVSRTGHAHGRPGSSSHEWDAAADADATRLATIADLKQTNTGHRGLGAVEPGRDYPKGVTDYGRSSAAEDYAESVRLYQSDAIGTGRLAGEAAERPLYFRDIYPARAAELDHLFPEIAARQKSEIKTLLAPKVAPAVDLSKLTVPRLRALAKERGVAIPVGAKKPDILRLLEPKKELTGAEQRAATRAATRERARQIQARATVEQTLAELDELLTKKAARSVFEERLAIAEGIDPKDLALLRAAAGDPAKLRAQITRVGKKSGITVEAKAGAKVKYDPALHDPVGAVPADGTPMVVIRRGTSVTVDGKTVVLNKATVKAAPAPAKKAAVAKKAATAKGSAAERSVATGRAPQFDLAKAARDQGISDEQLVRMREEIRVKRPPTVLGDEDQRFLSVTATLHDSPELRTFFEEHRDIYNHLVQEERLPREWVNAHGTPSVAAAQANATRTIRRAVAPGNPTVVRQSDEAHLRQVLADGRLKTQYETGTSGGYVDTAIRADFERMTFGLPHDLPLDQRPVYGYVAQGLEKDGGEALEQYGDIRIVLKPETRSRTTVSIGDSLDRRNELRPMPIGEADWHAVKPTQAYARVSSPQFRDSTYVEAQIHGGVKTTDIQEVIFGHQPSRETIAALDKAGVKWRIEGPPAKQAAGSVAKKAVPAKVTKAPARPSTPAIDRTGSPAEIIQQERAARRTALAAPPVKLEELAARAPTGTDARALGYYQRFGDEHMNGLLRKGKVGAPPGVPRAKLPPAEKVQESIDRIDGIMDRSKLIEPIVTYRGMSSVTRMFPGSKGGSLVGRTFRDKGFVSTSADRGIAAEFAVGEEMLADGVVMEVHVPPGVGAIQVSSETFIGKAPTGVSEREILLQRGLKFRVVSDDIVPEIYVDRRTGEAVRHTRSYRHLVVEVVQG